MRVIIVASFPGSLPNFRGALIEALCARGHVVEVAAPGLSSDAKTCEWLSARNITGHDIPMARAGQNPISDLRTFWSLWRLFRRRRPGAVLCYTIKPVIWGLLAARLALVPRRFALITGLGFAFTNRGTGRSRYLQRLAETLYRLALRGADLVMFQNPDDQREFADRRILKHDARSCIVNGSGVNTAAFAPTPLPDGPVRFLLIARLLGDKGIREFAEAARLLKHQGAEAEFHLVGARDPNPSAISEGDLAGWTSSGVLHWSGQMPDVRPAIAASHVYVLPSYREGTPRTVLEAMSMGRAIITTNAPGCRETVLKGENGVLVPVRDAKALADAMRRFVRNPALAAQMGARSRDIAEAKYDVRKVNAAMIAAMKL